MYLDLQEYIENIHTPRAKADGQQNAKGSYLIGLCTGQIAQIGAEQTHQTHIQEGGSKATQSKIVGGDLARLGHNLQKTVNHIAPVGHNNGRNDKADADKSKEKLS